MRACGYPSISILDCGGRGVNRKDLHGSTHALQGRGLRSAKSDYLLNGVGFGMKRARVFTKSLDIVGVLRVIV